MEQVLLWASLATGIVLFLLRFLPQRSEDASGYESNPPTDIAVPSLLRNTAVITPFVGLLLTLPPAMGVVFHNGQRLGIGFLLGGLTMLAGCMDLLRPRRTNSFSSSTVSLTSSYGTSIVAVSLALLFLRQSLFDGLLGVALGGFCVAFALFLGLPRTDTATTSRLAVGTGLLAALAAGASLGVFRDPLTPELAKLTWSAILIAFASFGSLLVCGAALLPAGKAGQWQRLLPLAVLVGIGGLALYQVAIKISNTPELAIPGIGGLLLWPVALAVLREGKRGNGLSATPLLSVPLLSILVITSGFLAALQTLQGVGVAIATVALFLSYAATRSLQTTSDNDSAVQNGAGGLLLFSTVLLLWRLFVTRWADDLRGVNLTDQYALFGLLVGAALPGLLASIPTRLLSNKTASGTAMLGALTACAVLALTSPATVLVLFGAKSAVALLIGLAVGAIPVLSGGTSLLPGLLAVAIALALDQFTGAILPTDTPTRAEKVRYLAGIVALIVVAVVAANRMGNGTSQNEEETK